jgi:hypothetical protein
MSQFNLVPRVVYTMFDTKVAIRVMSVRTKGAREKGALQATQDLNVLGKILLMHSIILYS